MKIAPPGESARPASRQGRIAQSWPAVSRSTCTVAPRRRPREARPQEPRRRVLVERGEDPDAALLVDGEAPREREQASAQSGEIIAVGCAAHRARYGLGRAQIARLVDVHGGQIRAQHPGGGDARAQVEARQRVATHGARVLGGHDPPAARAVAVRERRVEQPPPDPSALVLGRDREQPEAPEPLSQDRVRRPHHRSVYLGDPLTVRIELEVAREAP